MSTDWTAQAKTTTDYNTDSFETRLQGDTTYNESGYTYNQAGWYYVNTVPTITDVHWTKQGASTTAWN